MEASTVRDVFPTQVGVGRLEWKQNGLAVVQNTVVRSTVCAETGIVWKGGIAGFAPAGARFQETQCSALKPWLVADHPSGTQRREESRTCSCGQKRLETVYTRCSLEEIAVFQCVIGPSKIREEAVLRRIVDRGLSVGHFQQAVVVKNRTGHVAKTDAITIAVGPLKIRILPAIPMN